MKKVEAEDELRPEFVLRIRQAEKQHGRGDKHIQDSVQPRSEAEEPFFSR